ncbi:MAG TPA: hypothetical protein VN370_00080 [Desulfitobacteriaceae bacterium]|jgi:hypothetical protein|nr:hypothetical protein [Desulfitobacteriaceae bacterium]
MWRRILREIVIELYWLKKKILRYWQQRTPVGVLGIITIIFGLALFVIIAQGLARVYQLFIPYVSGGKIGQAYWSSIGFGIKTSFAFLLFLSSLILFIMLRFFWRR